MVQEADIPSFDAQTAAPDAAELEPGTVDAVVAELIPDAVGRQAVASVLESLLSATGEPLDENDLRRMQRLVVIKKLRHGANRLPLARRSAQPLVSSRPLLPHPNEDRSH